MLNVPWTTAVDIWSLGATVSVFVLAPNTLLTYSKGDMLSPATTHIRA